MSVNSFDCSSRDSLHLLKGECCINSTLEFGTTGGQKSMRFDVYATPNKAFSVFQGPVLQAGVTR